ncbi:MAG TPA: aldo/keto reductase [Gemmatimonadaceae bacterium]|nr:aldo/keto reductase [Gemmatimonadaceae bacterium]
MHTEGRPPHSARPTAPRSRHVRLGNVDVNRIGLGTNRLRNTDENVDFIRAAVDLGVRMIDTAHLYTGGESEKTIGRALSNRLSDVVVATKGGYGGAGRGRPDALRSEIEQSLASLRVDRIALYYLHRVDPETPIEESLGAIKEYVDKGAIERVGLSKVDTPLIERARTVVPIAAVQNEYNVAERTYDDVVDYCAREGIVFVPYYPLGAEPGRALRETARRHQTTPRQVMLAWLLKRSPATLPIPGTLSLAHLEENLGALSLELSEEEFRAIAVA